MPTGAVLARNRPLIEQIHLELLRITQYEVVQIVDWVEFPTAVGSEIR